MGTSWKFCPQGQAYAKNSMFSLSKGCTGIKYEPLQEQETIKSTVSSLCHGVFNANLVKQNSERLYFILNIHRKDSQRPTGLSHSLGRFRHLLHAAMANGARECSCRNQTTAYSTIASS